MIRECGAKSKGTGKPCRRLACKNGRCHLHGGMSTGPKTEEGLRRSRTASLKHGFYSAEAKEERRSFRKMINSFR